MDSTGITPVMNMGSDTTGFGSGGMWIFALLILLAIGNGGFFGGANRNNAATQSDVVYTSAFNQLQDENNAIRSDIQRVGYDNMTNVKDVAYNNLSEIRDLQAAVNTGFSNMQSCCCNTSKEILESRYLNAKAIADSQAVTSAQISALSSKIDQNKIEALQAKVSELQLAQATGNVVRYPNSWSYNAGPSPFCGFNGGF